MGGRIWGFLYESGDLPEELSFGGRMCDAVPGSC